MDLSKGFQLDKFEFEFDPQIFIGQLIGFAVIIAIIVKYVSPGVKSIMGKQQDQIKNQIAESKIAATGRKKAEQEYADAVSKAKAEGEELRAEAQQDAQKIRANLTQQTEVEVARLKQHGQEQVLLQRQQIAKELRSELGSAVHGNATVLVKERLAGEEDRSATVDNFIAELEGLAQSSGGAA